MYIFFYLGWVCFLLLSGWCFCPYAFAPLFMSLSLHTYIWPSFTSLPVFFTLQPRVSVLVYLQNTLLRCRTGTVPIPAFAPDQKQTWHLCRGNGILAQLNPRLRGEVAPSIPPSFSFPLIRRRDGCDDETFSARRPSLLLSVPFFVFNFST